MSSVSGLFDREARLVEAAVALLRSVPDHEMQIVVLNKALFYLDLLWLRDHGELLTGSPYIAMPMGPAVASYDRKLLRPLINKGLAVQNEQAVGSVKAKPVKLIGDQADFVFKHLTKEALSCAAEVAKAVKPHTSTRLSNFSHENAAWLAAREEAAAKGGSPPAIDMELALQQLNDDDDPWLSEPPDEEMQKALQEAARGLRG